MFNVKRWIVFQLRHARYFFQPEERESDYGRLLFKVWPCGPVSSRKVRRKAGLRCAPCVKSLSKVTGHSRTHLPKVGTGKTGNRSPLLSESSNSPM